MYDPIGECIEIIKANKKCPMFSYEVYPHIEYITNHTEQEDEASPKWEFGILDKGWMALEGLKKYRIWETKR